MKKSTNNMKYKIVNIYENIKEARQGITVDDLYFYAISDRHVGKYERKSGKKVLSRKYDDNIKHLNGGFIDGDNLVCTHNPKGINSIVTINKHNLEIINRYDLTNTKLTNNINSTFIDGTNSYLTWISRYNSKTYGVIAFYKEHVDNTIFCEFDEKFNIINSWKFPKKVLSRLKPWSVSGGFVKNGYIYASGHDKGEIYILHIKDDKNILELLEIIDVKSSGQGVSYHNNNLFVIHRKKKQVIEYEFI
jgi:hypothetical protein